MHLCTREQTPGLFDSAFLNSDSISSFIQFSMDQGNKQLARFYKFLQLVLSNMYNFIYLDIVRKNFNNGIKHDIDEENCI